jgi:hypothetical protein
MGNHSFILKMLGQATHKMQGWISDVYFKRESWVGRVGVSMRLSWKSALIMADFRGSMFGMAKPNPFWWILMDSRCSWCLKLVDSR